MQGQHLSALANLPPKSFDRLNGTILKRLEKLSIGGDHRRIQRLGQGQIKAVIDAAFGLKSQYRNAFSRKCYETDRTGLANGYSVIGHCNPLLRWTAPFCEFSCRATLFISRKKKSGALSSKGLLQETKSIIRQCIFSQEPLCSYAGIDYYYHLSLSSRISSTLSANFLPCSFLRLSITIWRA